MAIKAVLETLDGLDEGLKGLYVEHEGKFRLDVDGGFKTPDEIDGLVSALNKERDAHSKLAKAIKKFEGIEDPADAVKALEIVKNLDQKKLIDAGEVERVKEEVSKAMQTKIDELQGTLEEKDAILNKELIGGRFARSKFITDKLLIPADMVESRFGSAFKLEDGKVVAYDQHGNKIYSKENPGEVAGFDEALSALVNAYQYKDDITRGSQNPGSGSTPGSQGGGQSSKQITRAQLDSMNPAGQMDFFKNGGQVVDG